MIAVVATVVVLASPFAVWAAYKAGARAEKRRSAVRSQRDADRDEKREFDAVMDRINRNIGRAEARLGMNSDRDILDGSPALDRLAEKARREWEAGR